MISEVVTVILDVALSGVVYLEQELDGSAIAVGLASSPGLDWLKDIVPLLSVRLKVHNALRTLINEEMVGVYLR